MSFSAKPARCADLVSYVLAIRKATGHHLQDRVNSVHGANIGPRNLQQEITSMAVAQAAHEHDSIALPLPHPPWRRGRSAVRCNLQ